MFDVRCSMFDVRCSMFDVSAINPQSRQKPQQSRQIVPHQGKRLFFGNPPAGWGEPAVERSKRVPRFSLSAGERAGVRASVTTNQSPFAPTRGQSRQKPQQSCLIKAHQALSRHPLKNESTPHHRATPTCHAPVIGCWARDPKSETRDPFPQNHPPPRKMCAFLNWASCYSIVCLSVN